MANIVFTLSKFTPTGSGTLGFTTTAPATPNTVKPGDTIQIKMKLNDTSWTAAFGTAKVICAMGRFRGTNERSSRANPNFTIAHAPHITLTAAPTNATKITTVRHSIRDGDCSFELVFWLAATSSTNARSWRDDPSVRVTGGIS